MDKRFGTAIGCGFMPSNDDMKEVVELLNRNKVDLNNMSIVCMETHGAAETANDFYVGRQRLADIITEEQARAFYLKTGKEKGWPLPEKLSCMKFTLLYNRQCWFVFPT
jgi:cobalamin biosynthesis Co2+ chelatase CbiK